MNFNDTLTALAKSMREWPEHRGDNIVFDGRVITIEQWKDRSIELGLKVENNMNESTLVPREEMSDLDWLARNVHEWPEQITRVYSISLGKFCDFFPTGTKVITKQQWLARRAELQNKPSWKDAPEWAQYLVQNSIGLWTFTRYEPRPNSAGGWSMDRNVKNHGNRLCVNAKDEVGGEVLGDWRDTLEKRPEQDEFEPFVGVEDAAATKQHDPVNSPSHYASGGIECIDAIRASMSHEAFLGYLKGNVQKYMWRYEKKVNPSEDLKKAKWYLSKLIEEQK